MELAFSTILGIPLFAAGLAAGIFFWADSYERNLCHSQLTSIALNHNGRAFVSYAYSVQNGNTQGYTNPAAYTWNGSFYTEAGYIYSLDKNGQLISTLFYFFLIFRHKCIKNSLNLNSLPIWAANSIRSLIITKNININRTNLI